MSFDDFAKRAPPTTSFPNMYVVSGMFMLLAFTVCVRLAPFVDEKYLSNENDIRFAACGKDRLAGIVFTGPPERVTEGLDLYQRKAFRHLRISGRDIGGNSARDLIKSGNFSTARVFDVSGISLDRYSYDTKENAADAARWLSAQNDVCGVVLITSTTHMPRALYLLREYMEAYPRSLPVTGYAVPENADYTLSERISEYAKFVATVCFAFESRVFGPAQTPLAPKGLAP